MKNAVGKNFPQSCQKFSNKFYAYDKIFCVRINKLVKV